MASLLIAESLIAGSKGQAMGRVMFDTGASHSFVRRALAEQVAAIEKLPRPKWFTLGDGRSMHVLEVAILTLYLGETEVEDTFMIFPGDRGVEEVVLGTSTMRKFRLKIDLEKSAVYAEIKEEEHSAQRREEKTMNEVLTTLFARLNITAGENTTDEEAIEKIADTLRQAQGERGSARAAPVAAPAILAALELTPEATEAEVKGAILALQNPGNVIPIEQHQEVANKLATLERQHFLSLAQAEGKVTPAEMADGQPLQKLYADDFPTFKAFVEKRGKQIPLQQKPPEAPQKNATMQIDDIQAQINKQLGLDTEIFAKYAQH